MEVTFKMFHRVDGTKKLFFDPRSGGFTEYEKFAHVFKLPQVSSLQVIIEVYEALLRNSLGGRSRDSTYDTIVIPLSKEFEQYLLDHQISYESHVNQHVGLDKLYLLLGTVFYFGSSYCSG